MGALKLRVLGFIGQFLCVSGGIEGMGSVSSDAW